jgi:GMP synthase (glutamine-hydrolysing)
MKLLIIESSDPEHKAFNKPLERMVAKVAEYEMRNYRDINEGAETVRGYAGVILSGVPIHYDFDSLYDRASRFEWIRNTTTPILGICLGHEVLGHLFSSELIRDREAEKGLLTMHIMQTDPIFEGIAGSKFKAQTQHRASVTVPTDFTVLASSRRCANTAMRHQTKPVYGFQFHPERSEVGALLLGNFAKISQAASADSQNSLHV